MLPFSTGPVENLLPSWREQLSHFCFLGIRPEFELPDARCSLFAVTVPRSVFYHQRQGLIISKCQFSNYVHLFSDWLAP